MGKVVTTVWTCDRCGAQVTAPELPPGCCTLDYAIVGGAKGELILCPSCTEQLTVWVSTPPQ